MLNGKHFLCNFSLEQGTKLTVYEQFYELNKNAFINSYGTPLTDWTANHPNATSFYTRENILLGLKERGLKAEVEHFLLLFYWWIQPSNVSNELAKNVLSYKLLNLREPEMYSYLLPHVNDLITKRNDRVLQTILYLTKLFPIDPLFFYLTNSTFFSQNKFYMLFSQKRNGDARLQSQLTGQQFILHAQFEFNLVNFLDAHSVFFADILQHYGRLSNYIFLPSRTGPQPADFSNSQTENDLNPTEWMGNKDFPHFLTQFIYFVYFTDTNTTTNMDKISRSLGHRIRVHVKGLLARYNYTVHLVCTALRNTYPNSSERGDVGNFIYEVLYPLVFWEMDSYNTWRHALIPYNGQNPSVGTICTAIATANDQRIRAMNTVNGIIQSIVSTTTDTSVLLKFNINNLKIISIFADRAVAGVSLVYSFDNFIKILKCELDQETLVLTVDYENTVPVVTRKRLKTFANPSLVNFFRIVVRYNDTVIFTDTTSQAKYPTMYRFLSRNTLKYPTLPSPDQKTVSSIWSEFFAEGPRNLIYSSANTKSAFWSNSTILFSMIPTQSTSLVALRSYNNMPISVYRSGTYNWPIEPITAGAQVRLTTPFQFGKETLTVDLTRIDTSIKLKLSPTNIMKEASLSEDNESVLPVSIKVVSDTNIKYRYFNNPGHSDWLTSPMSLVLARITDAQYLYSVLVGNVLDYKLQHNVHYNAQTSDIDSVCLFINLTITYPKAKTVTSVQFDCDHGIEEIKREIVSRQENIIRHQFIVYAFQLKKTSRRITLSAWAVDQFLIQIQYILSEMIVVDGQNSLYSINSIIV